MLTKPDTCKPCPLYRDGRGFVPDRAVQGAALLVLAQNPGDSEEQGLEVTGYQGKSPLTKPCDPQPLVGPAGYTMTKRFLPLTGLLREEVSLCNVLRCRLQDPQAVTPSNPQGRVNTMPTGKVLEEAVRHCSQYLHIPESTRLIIAQGAHAWGFLGGPGKVSAWRGHLSPMPYKGIPTLATTHLADLRHNPWMQLICQMDWKKAGDYLRGVQPLSLPEIETDPYRIVWEPGMAFDTEYAPETKYLYRFSIATPSGKVYVIEADDWFAARHHLQSELSEAFEAHTLHALWWSQDSPLFTGHVSKVLQEQEKRPALGAVPPGSSKEAKETTLRRVLQRDAPLDGVSQSAKADGSGHSVVRRAAEGTSGTMRNMSNRSSLGPGPLPQNQHATGPLVLSLQSGHWRDAGRHPDIVSGRVVPFTVVFQNAPVDLPHLAKILPEGACINVEDCLQLHAVLWCELPHDLEFLASVYGKYPKLKHLAREAPVLYSAGDALETLSVWNALKAELVADPTSEPIYHTQLCLLPHVDESMQRGIAVDASKVEPAATAYREKMAEGQRLAEAYTGYPINLNSPQQMQRWLYEVEGFKVIKHPKTKKPTVDESAIVVMRNKYLVVDPLVEASTQGTLDRIAAGGHPLLEALALYGAAEHAMSHYITPLHNEDGTVKTRIYHSIAIHTQANARWSWTDPPLAQLPKDLRNLFMPDPGWPWFCFDHDQIELRMVAGYSGDPAMLKAFADGWDVHLLATVAMFDLPPPPTYVNTIHDPACMAWRASVRWKECDHANEVCGKDDIRRHFAKTFGHRQSYGGTAGRSGDIPGAKELGLTPHRLSQMSVMRASLFSGLAKWQNDMVASATRIGETRTWAGRRRRYLSKEYNYLRGEMLDHPMQAGVQDLENAIILEVKEKFGSDVYIVYGMHDSQKWGVKEERWTEIVAGIQEITTRPRLVNGRWLDFPASFSERWA